MYITSTAKLRFYPPYNINNLRIEQNRRMHNNSWSTTIPFDVDWPTGTCQIFKHRTDLQTQNRSSWWLTHFLSSYAIHANAFKPSIKQQQTPEVFINITIIRFCSNFILLHAATMLSMDATDYWPMAREYSIWNATIASLQFWTSSYPWQSYRTSLHHILLLTFKPYTPSAIWWNTIWLLCNCIEFSLWPATVTSWWRLWEWFRYHRLTHSTKKDSKNSPCFQHGTHFIWTSTCHSAQYTTNSTQTSAQMTILQFSRQLHSRQHSRMSRQYL